LVILKIFPFCGTVLVDDKSVTSYKIQEFFRSGFDYGLNRDVPVMVRGIVGVALNNLPPTQPPATKPSASGESFVAHIGRKTGKGLAQYQTKMSFCAKPSALCPPQEFFNK
jgi:hypothetical protein